MAKVSVPFSKMADVIEETMNNFFLVDLDIKSIKIKTRILLEHLMETSADVSESIETFYSRKVYQVTASHFQKIYEI